MPSVDQVMSPRIYSIAPNEPAEQARRFLLSIGGHAVPVVDTASARPLGMLALDDLGGDLQGLTVADRMSAPPVTVPRTASLEDAARGMVFGSVHHAPVVDDAGVAVGFVSVLDVLRGMLGEPVPAREPEQGADLPVAWTGELALTRPNTAEVPGVPGVFELVAASGPGAQTIVWADSTADLSTRFAELLADPPDRAAWYVENGPLRFRWAEAASVGARWRMLAGLMREVAPG